MLYIRTDGNAEIGTGHVMRCLSIAASYRQSSGDCTFITADEYMMPLLNEQGFSVICLDSKWDDLNQETMKMLKLVDRCRIEKLLIDSYFVTPDYLSRLNTASNLIYMDDLDEFVYSCTELINYNIYADEQNYRLRYPNAKLLLGPKYAPLRREFSNLPHRKINERTESVLVTTGGNDRYNVAGKLLAQAKQNPNLSKLAFHVVSGRCNKHLAQLQAIAEKCPGVAIHQNVKNISNLMLTCDIAVSAGGTTVYELCACAIPTVLFSMADNQRAVVSAFGKEHMLGCGDWRECADSCLERLLSGIVELAGDTQKRCEMSSKCKELVDGLGSTRISQSIGCL